MAAAGGEHSLQVDAKGRMHVCGGCGGGYCRLEALMPRHFGWRRVQGIEGVKLFKALYYHNLAVSASGQLYAFGCGTFTDGNGDGALPAMGIVRDSGKMLDADKGQAAHEVGGFEHETIRSLEGGAFHSVILTASGRVKTFGAAQLGQLGRKVEGSVTDGSGLPVDPVARDVEGLDTNDSVAAIGAGFYNTLVACKSGILYCAGENQNSQCGQASGENANLRIMTKVKELGSEHVVKACGGYCHTLVLTGDSRVLSLGCNEDGQRGYPSDQPDAIVSEVALPTTSRPIDVQAGANHSIVLMGNGEVYTFGSNEFGQCGTSTALGGSVTTPTRVELDGVKIVKVSAGYAHSIVVDEKNKSLAFGQNESGQLGLGAETFEAKADQVKPVPMQSLPS